MSGGTNTTTQTANSQPWKEAQPLLKTGLGDAQALYDAGVGGQTYTGSTVVPDAAQTTQAMNTLQTNATNNLGGQGISGAGQNIVANGGYNAPQQQSMDYLNGVGTNPFDLSQNQAYQTYRGGLANDVTNAVNQNAAGAGRYGSGMHTQNLTNDLTKALSTADLAQMQRMDSLNSQRFNAGQQGISNLSTGYDLQNLPTQDLMQVGARAEDLYGRQLNDQLRIFQDTQNAPWNQIARLNAVASGAGQYGTQTTTAQQPGQNPLLTGLGYGMSGLGILGSL